jgi:hypothetical protein
MKSFDNCINHWWSAAAKIGASGVFIVRIRDWTHSRRRAFPSEEFQQRRRIR